MEFLVEFDIEVPAGTDETDAMDRQEAEAAAAAVLADQGHLLRLWKLPAESGVSKAIGLYSADDQAQLSGLLNELPLSDWMQETVTPLAPHPNDPESAKTAE
jgi:muconolactone D-isomerase